MVTDGGGSCTSISVPQRPYIYDKNMCPDWELPTNISTMITKWRTDPSTPINTFVVGVPGSDSTGQTIGAYDTPPYSMLLALSTYAVAGSPSTVDPTCDQSLMWTATGGNPAHPCHIDLSNGNNFNAGALAKRHRQPPRRRRSAAPTRCRPRTAGPDHRPRRGQRDRGHQQGATTIPQAHQRIGYVPDGAGLLGLRRGRGRWILIGVTCADVSTSAMAKVEVDVGCTTVTRK